MGGATGEVWESRATTGRWTRGGTAFLLGLLACVMLVPGGCSSRQRKLSRGGNVADSFVHDFLGVDRDPDEYYNLVESSHDAQSETFQYRVTEDPFLIDKNIDAVTRLGDASIARLEGQAQVVVKLSEVLLEDPSSLARASAANSLTKIALRLPRYRVPTQQQEEMGDVFLALLQEMDRMYDRRGRPCGNAAAIRQRTIQILDQIGDFQIQELSIAKDSLRPFYSRAYLIDASDPALRQAIDTALVKRMWALIRVSLQAALDDPIPYVRTDAVRGLKTLGDRTAKDAIMARLEVESHWRVRAEAVEYLGKIGGEEAVASLLPMLEDADPTIRFKARQALTRIAGRDLGIRRRTWTRWARSRYPELAQRLDEEESDASDVADQR